MLIKPHFSQTNCRPVVVLQNYVYALLNTHQLAPIIQPLQKSEGLNLKPEVHIMVERWGGKYW